MSEPRVTLGQAVAAYGVAVLAMGVLDGVWLGWLALDFYKHELGTLMATSVRVVPAALYYLGFPAAIVFLALTPRPSGWASALVRSAVLGLAAFGVYDLTNLATLRGYSVRMAVVDMAYGAFASAVGGGLAYALVIRRRVASAGAASTH